MDELEEEKLFKMLKDKINKTENKNNAKDEIHKELSKLLEEMMDEFISPEFLISIETNKEDKTSHIVKIKGSKIGIEMGLSFLIHDLVEKDILSKKEILKAVQVGLEGV